MQRLFGKVSVISNGITIIFGGVTIPQLTSNTGIFCNIVFPIAYTSTNYKFTFGFTYDNGNTTTLRQHCIGDRYVTTTSIGFFNGYNALLSTGFGNYIFIGY